jgi:hypothetical protein
MSHIRRKSIETAQSDLTPLNESRKEFRLFQIHPGKDEDTIACTLKTYRLGSWKGSPKFMALSYFWGDQKHSETINVNGSPMNVTPNLKELLQHFRSLQNSSEDIPYRSADSWLFVDSICVHQGNVRDLNYMVPLIPEILSTATRVLVWLGPGDEGSDKFMDWANSKWFPPDLMECLWNRPGTGVSSRSHQYMKRPQRQKLAEYTFGATPDEMYWMSLTILFRPWFSRTLIVQEVAIAKKTPLVFCGSKSISLINLAATLKLTRDACNWLSYRPNKMHRSILANYFHFDNASELLKSFHTNHERLDCAMNVRLTLSLTRNSEISLRQALDWTCFHKATDPKDNLYGILGIIPKSVRSKIHIDFQQDVWEMTPQAILSACKSYSFLDTTISYRDRVTERPSTEPSWLPDFRQTADDYFMLFRSKTMWQDQPPISASKGGKVVSVPTTMLDTIDAAKLIDFDPYHGQKQLQELERIATAAQQRELATNHPLSPFRKLPEKIWQALLLNTDIDLFGDQLTLSSTESKFQTIWNSLSQMEQSPLSPDLDCFSEWWFTTSESTVAILAKEIQLRTHDLSFVTTSTGLLGIGPLASQPGDELAIFHGTHSIVALRPNSAAGAECFTLLGPVFVLNLTERFEQLDTLYKSKMLKEKNVKLV